MSYLLTYADDVKHFEWETLLAEITQYAPREIKRHFETESYKRVIDEIAALRICLSELERRVNERLDPAY